jgi:cytochrome c oxidase assembly factor CtaG
MTAGAATGRPHPAAWWRTRRAWSLVGAAVALLFALAPPLATVARRADYAAALQLSLLAIVVPALVTLGAPWRLLRLSCDVSPGTAAAAGTATGPVDRLADRRRRHPELVRALAFIGADLAAVVAWHTPRAVEAVARQGWVAAFEALTLLALGTGLWLELVHSPPLTPRSGHLRRAGLGAVVMWVFWVQAYVVGLSTRSFYPNFHHVAGGLSAAADQQIASAVSWFVAAVAFVPVIFWNAVMWLKTEDDPDTELITLIRTDRRRGAPPLTGNGGSRPS